MAEFTIKFDVQKVASEVLDEFIYNGKSLRQWADCIANGDCVQVVHGCWVDRHDNPVGWNKDNYGYPASNCYCSACGDWLTASDEYPVRGLYCPNCGAKMDEMDGE